MAVCICCLYEVLSYTTAEDNTNLCDYCRDEGEGKIENGEVVIISDIDPPKPKRIGRPKGAKDLKPRRKQNAENKGKDKEEETKREDAGRRREMA